MPQKVSLSEKSEIKAYIEIDRKKKKLQKKYSVSQPVMSKPKKKINETGQIERKANSGRHLFLNSNDIF